MSFRVRSSGIPADSICDASLSRVSLPELCGRKESGQYHREERNKNIGVVAQDIIGNAAQIHKLLVLVSSGASHHMNELAIVNQLEQLDRVLVGQKKAIMGEAYSVKTNGARSLL
jgi:hypothetical protein